MIKYFFEEFILSVKKEINTFAALINRGIHNKDYSVVNIKESQNYFLIVEVLFLFPTHSVMSRIFCTFAYNLNPAKA